ncbi:MAG: AAA family ATPase [Nanoarchaeota archaeon]|nr:AAA family ATPase [Nanoarchaeota archaeon]
MIITIAGLPGSGKSTVARLLCSELGYKHYSMGDFRGEIAQKHGITIDELNEIGKKDDWPHREADEFLEQLGRTKDNLVIDTWIGFHLIPRSVKVFMSIDPKVAAKRIFNDQHNRPDERRYNSVKGVEETLGNRILATDEGFKRLYGVSFLDKKQYDLVLDTTDMSPEEVARRILEFLNKNNSKNHQNP